MKRLISPITILFVLIFAVSCSNDIIMELPQGPEGPEGKPGKDGKSAYELWVEFVNDGTIEWEGGTDVNNFFLFLKGKDGKDGINGVDGIDGVDGKSAYEIWIEEVEKGIEDPHNPGSQWDKDKITIQDFWYYLTGADGKDGQDGQNGLSAYELWVVEVANGIEDPHNPGQEWDKDKNSLENFWEYLRGADGKDGKSAYELWVELVNNGTYPEWTGGTTEVDFFLFLKGKDGKDGINGVDGIDGVDGKSAYEIWKDEVATGNLDDPHNPGDKWPTSDDSDVDFWYFLTGADGADGVDGKDGMSAYELWREEIKTIGLLNPHADDGSNWDPNKDTLADFWEYLRGRDGVDGKDGEDGKDGKPGDLGTPGADVVIVLGKPNVIAQYSQQTYNEYVKPEDGSVTYIVYDHTGTVAPGAKVKGLPGMDPNKEFTADGSGMFTISKDDLPVTGTVVDRHGVTASVTYSKDGVITTEESAPNTYVPQKIEVRVQMYVGSTSTPQLGDEMYSKLWINFVVERRVDASANWYVLPSYLSRKQTYVKVYELGNPVDPKSYTTSSKTYYSGYRTVVGSYVSIGLPRPVKKWKYMTSETDKIESYLKTLTNEHFKIWDDADKYMTLVVEGYYGESPSMPAVIKHAPIQIAPIPENVTIYNVSSDKKTFNKGVAGSFNVSDVDYDLCFEKSYTKVSKTGYDLYEPAVIDQSTVKDMPLLGVALMKTISGNDIILKTSDDNYATINNPQFDCDAIAYNESLIASIGTGTTGRIFLPPSFFGLLVESEGVGGIIGVKDFGFNVPDFVGTISNR